MNDKQTELMRTVMDMIAHQGDLMDDDTFYSPPMWILDNWWHTLNAVLKLSQVGDHGDSKSNSLEPTDQTESEKGNEDV